jgi:hypothetical protein
MVGLAMLLFAAAAVSVVSSQLTVLAVQSSNRILYAIRVYQTKGPSQVDWFEMTVPDRQSTKLADDKSLPCVDPAASVSPAAVKKAEAVMEDNGKLLTWSSDGTLFAYVARDPSIAAPETNPWGCNDCFYSVVKLVRAGDAKLLAKIPLPPFSDRWNYAQEMKWSPNGNVLLVGAEAGSSDSHFSDYWLLDWAKQTWRYLGGGNRAKWSPDSSQILWTRPRTLESLGRINVWVVHLALFDLRSFKEEALTSGISYVSDFCLRHV